MVGGEEFRNALLEAEILRSLVAIEVLGVGNDGAVHGEEIIFSLRWCDISGRQSRLVADGPVFCRFEAVFEGADDAVGIAGGEAMLPAIHPLGIEASDRHCYQFKAR